MEVPTLTHKFVELIPDDIEPGVLYVSLEYATVAHRCCCGCGQEVITPLSPTDWNLTFDGVSISLTPSIGNWSFQCRSHYWIESSHIRWAKGWSDVRIEQGRDEDIKTKTDFYDAEQSETEESSKPTPVADMQSRDGVWESFKSIFRW